MSLKEKIEQPTRVPKTITLPPEVLVWAEQKSSDELRTFSHFIESRLRQEMDSDQVH